MNPLGPAPFGSAQVRIGACGGDLDTCDNDEGASE